MRRRDVIVGLGGGALAWAAVARAQESKSRRVGVLMALPAEDPNGRDRVSVFRQALRERGWTEGVNLKIDFRWSDNRALIPRYAAELVALAPDVILAGSGLV